MPLKEFVEKRLKIKRKILVVEDEHVERVILGKMLENEYQVLLAENGIEALEIMQNLYDTLSLVLLDLVMPQMDGFDFLLEVQKNERLWC